MNLQFGAGLLYGTPTAGNLPTNPTPIRLLLQEVSVEFKGDLKKLWAQQQMPIAKARGKVDVTGKAKIVNFDPDPINQLFWAQTSAVGIEIPVDREQHTLDASAASITVTNASSFRYDNGVQWLSGSLAGAAAIKVASNVQAGQYSVNSSTGVYSFAAADANNKIAISYTYEDNARGRTIELTNQLMGYAPEVRMDVFNIFRNKVLGIRLNSCVIGSWTYPSKLEDFWVSDITFDASTDASDSLGKIFADVV